MIIYPPEGTPEPLLTDQRQDHQQKHPAERYLDAEHAPTRASSEAVDGRPAPAGMTSAPVTLAATMLPLPGGADGIHCVSGILLLTACAIHLIWHERWIKAVILDKPKSLTPTLCRRRLFWGMLLSGFLCGLSGLVTLSLGHIFLSQSVFNQKSTY
jgi:hypothetical protein